MLVFTSEKVIPYYGAHMRGALSKMGIFFIFLCNKNNDEGSQLVSNTNQLKLLAPDGKMRLTDVADTEQILRLIQSI